MKALTNILNYILLLLMILIASCTEDTAEVDDLVREEEYVTVRMQVPGMKNATTRAEEAEDNLTSVWALVFRDGKLVSKTEVTTAESTLIPSTSTIGTFNLSRPKVKDVIHFLGNVPSGVTLPNIGDDESALCNLETDDRENLSYWGKATYNGGDITVNLYRHLAKIEIAPDPNECTFPEDQLFIAGLVNANQKGKLVPYDDGNGAFNFDLSDENYGGNYDYCTVPAKPDPLDKTPLLDNFGAGFKNWLYVFEHENPETADGLYVICKIGKYYYKVALTSDGKTPYDIIRNHKYTILVKDLDEVVVYVPDDITEEKEIEEYKYKQALKYDPVNFVVREYKDVTLTLPSSVTLDYTKSNPSASKLSLTVGGIKNVVETLTFNAPGFTIQPGDGAAATAENGVFKITNTSKESIGFTFTLTDPDEVGSISVTGAGKYVNEITSASTTVTLKESIEVTPTTSTLYYDSDDTQVVTVDVTVPDGVETLNIGGAEKFEVKQGDNMLTATEGVYSYTVTDNSNPIPFTFTLNAQNVTSPQTITFSDPSETVNAASVAISMAQTPTVTFTKYGSQTIRMNDTPLSVTMDVPEGKTLSDFSITVSPETGLDVAQGENPLTLNDDGVYTTTNVSSDQTFTFTPSETGTYTITFSGEGTDVNMPDESGRMITLRVEEASGGGEPNDSPILWFMDGLSITPSYGDPQRLKFNDEGIATLQLYPNLYPNLYLGFLYEVANDSGRALWIKNYNSTNNNNQDLLPSVHGSNLYSVNGQTEIQLTQDDVDAIINYGGGVSFWGSPDATIYKVYISTSKITQ